MPIDLVVEAIGGEVTKESKVRNTVIVITIPYLVVEIHPLVHSRVLRTFSFALIG